MTRRYGRLGFISFYNNKTIISDTFDIRNGDVKEEITFELEIDCILSDFIKLDDNEKIEWMKKKYFKALPQTQFKSYIEEKAEKEFVDAIRRGKSTKFIWARVFKEYRSDDEEEGIDSIIADNYIDLVKYIKIYEKQEAGEYDIY